MKRKRSNECSRCGCPREKNRFSQSYCLKCHNAYMREHRPKYSEFTEDQRRKAIARAYVNVYLSRGIIDRKPCEIKGCGGHAEMHHDDYSKPLDVRWLCEKHHIKFHRVTS